MKDEKMNDEKLNELLELKKNITADFSKTRKAFADEFFTKTVNPDRMRFSAWQWRAAAVFLIVAALISAMMLPLLKNSSDTADSRRKLAETARLFGADAAVLFFNNELVTGERESADAPVNFVDVKLQFGTRDIDLELVCSDSDSIYLDTAEFSGDVVISRCDASTLVLDMELKIDGRKIRTVIPVVRGSGNHYEGNKLS